MADDETWFYWENQTLYLNIYLQPRASKNRIVGVHDHQLKISLTTPPVDNRANEDLVAFIALQLGVPKRQVALVKGKTSRRKLLKIDNADDKKLREIAAHENRPR